MEIIKNDEKTWHIPVIHQIGQSCFTTYCTVCFQLQALSHHPLIHLLPLMYLYKLNDIMFLIKSLKTAFSSFNLYNFIASAPSTTTSSATNNLIHHRTTSTLTKHFYFTRISHLWIVSCCQTAFFHLSLWWQIKGLVT